jgi:hypothetical protein
VSRSAGGSMEGMRGYGEKILGCVRWGFGVSYAAAI